MNNKDLKFIFFGTDNFSVIVLDELKKAGFIPKVIVTQPDKPAGRKQTITPPLTKIWGEKEGVKILQPEKLDDDFIKELVAAAATSPSTKNENETAAATDNTLPSWDLSITASYGKIIPEKVLNIPEHKSLNVHPSLLPLYRGASPVESAILSDDKDTGVTIMRMNAGMDTGPIIDQELVHFDEWPEKEKVLEKLGQIGGQILANIIPEWISGNIDEQEQDDGFATYTKLIKKEDGELDLADDPYKNFLKYKAYKPWPGTFFFKDGKRIKVTSADFINGEFKILKVIPEGKGEMDYVD